MTAKTKPGKAKAGTSKEGAESRRRLFVEAFVANGGNATEAAKAAGYSAASARYQGSKLLADPNVSQQIAARSEKLAKKYELTADLVTRSIVQELTFDPAKLYGPDGKLLQISELPEDVRMALQSVEFEQIGSLDAPVYVRKVKFAPKAQAREQAMKHLGMFERDNKQRNPLEGVPRETLRAIAERLRGGS
jgi:phage terminase small subunit